MNEEERLEVLKEIAEYYHYSEREPGDVTADEVAEHLRKSKETARTLLKRMVRIGRLAAVRVVEDGHTVTVYRKKDRNPLTLTLSPEARERDGEQ